MNYIILFILKYILGYFLQDIVIVLGVYTFSKVKVDKRSFFLIIAVLLPTSICVRMLPMSYGVNILINMGMILFATYKFCDLELYSIIRSTLFSTFLVLITETVSFSILLLLFGKVLTDAILQDPILKASVYVPFNLMMGGIIYLCYRRMIKKYY